MRLPSVLWCISVCIVAGCVVIRNPNFQTGLHPTEGGRGTAPMAPSWTESEEATASQLRMARDIGMAVGAELAWVRTNAAVSSGAMHAGEYDLAYVITPATAWYAAGSGDLHPRDAAAMHLGVVVRDGADGRTVPGLRVRAALVDGAGRTVAAGALPFGWHPILNRYGDDWPIAAGGPYTLRVVIGAPRFRRHDPTNGDRFADSTVAEFTGVTIAPGGLAALAGREGSPEALRLARAEGAALGRSMYEMIGSEAVNGQVMRYGDYLVIAGVEFSEGYWTMRGSSLHYDVSFEQSAARNAHVEVAALDALTGRFLPDLNVRATLLRDGREIGTMAQPFMWHPWLYHYGENWRVPHSGYYDIRVHLDAPPYRRYGPITASLMTQPIDTVFRGVKIVTGEK